METVFEDISITNEFKIEHQAFMEFSEAGNESKLFTILFNNVNLFFFFIVIYFIDTIESEEFRNCTTVEQGEEVKEQEMDVISLSSSTLSDFDVITEEEIDLLK